MRRWLFGLLVLAGLVLWLGRAALAPIDHGIERRAFRADEKAGEPVERWVRAAPDAPPTRPSLW